MVECDLAKVEVAGSNPVSRSRFPSSRTPPWFGSSLLGAFQSPATIPGAHFGESFWVTDNPGVGVNDHKGVIDTNPTSPSCLPL